MSNSRPTINQCSALEMTMQEVRAAMEDFSADFAFAESCGGFEILSIEPPAVEARRRRTEAASLSLVHSRRHVA